MWAAFFIASIFSSIAIQDSLVTSPVNLMLAPTGALIVRVCYYNHKTDAKEKKSIYFHLK